MIFCRSVRCRRAATDHKSSCHAHLILGLLVKVLSTTGSITCFYIRPKRLENDVVIMLGGDHDVFQTDGRLSSCSTATCDLPSGRRYASVDYVSLQRALGEPMSGVIGSGAVSVSSQA